MSGSSAPSAPSAPRVRPAVLADGDVLALIDRVTWSPLHAVTPEPQPPYADFFDARHPPEEYLVAESGGRVVGYVRLGRSTPLDCNAHVRQIQGLAVADEARGRGVGRALVRAAVEETRRRGARRLTLRVLGHNAPARRLYESEGFAVEGVLPGEFLLAGEYVDDVLMGRAV
ncbi:GNAT family N-acetyltransferase [Streptomyces antibioticus]|uniref:Acetyltransferase n=1 Tax=Streptomyces antibioticus TaxID=1890 RepID=A0AAE6Y685_STRAT|nr:GNAT family N-acetyltransferase [Streptomyces antibioticus]OOQ52962.1 acetyltransferase [Streptomyces antibioticus]QIT44118.1 GNAT family N-acetyltransferase [Streptomyces antibioticus]